MPCKVLPNWSKHSINIVDVCGHDHREGKKPWHNWYCQVQDPRLEFKFMFGAKCQFKPTRSHGSNH
jgi:hypothetical protein